MYCKDRVVVIEFSCFNSIIIYKFNLYKYEGQAYILSRPARHYRTWSEKGYIWNVGETDAGCPSERFEGGEISVLPKSAFLNSSQTPLHFSTDFQLRDLCDPAAALCNCIFHHTCQCTHITDKHYYLPTFEIVNLYFRYVLSYVSTIKYLPDTCCIVCLMMAGVIDATRK